MNRLTYRQAVRFNDGRPTCPVCFIATSRWKICDRCYAELSTTGQLLEKIAKENPCLPTSPNAQP